MVEIKCILEKYEAHGDKTGWTFVIIPAAIVIKLAPIKKMFRVKGTIDNHVLAQVSIMPVGNGDFMLPVNGIMRRAIGKKKGAGVLLRLEYDPTDLSPDDDFMICLQDDPKALAFHETLNKSHKNYFTKWISSAKTAITKANRIAMAIDALNRKMRFDEMLREKKG